MEGSKEGLRREREGKGKWSCRKGNGVVNKENDDKGDKTEARRRQKGEDKKKRKKIKEDREKEGKWS